jgi:hypothetical protein
MFLKEVVDCWEVFKQNFAEIYSLETPGECLKFRVLVLNWSFCRAETQTEVCVAMDGWIICIFSLVEVKAK